MATFFITLGVLLLIVGGMSIGVLLANKPIKGSCGGMANLGIDTNCDICGGNPKKCDEEQERIAREEAGEPQKGPSAADLAYDATKEKKSSDQTT